MEYISTGTRTGIRKGIREILERQLILKFEKIPVSCSEKLKTGSRENLLKWGDKILISESIDEVFLD